MSLRFTRRMISCFGHEAVGVADVDGDGHLDLISGGLWYQGPDFTRWHRIYTPAVSGEYVDDFSSICLDIAGNGRPDVITGGWWGQALVWYENPGVTPGRWQQRDWLRHVIAADCGNIETTRAWDLDGDGHQEILPNTPNHPLCAYRVRRDAEGRSLADFDRHCLFPEPLGHGLGVGDVDGDGRSEILTPRGILHQPAGGPWSGPWELRPGPAFPWTHLSVPILVVDADGDGVAELIVGNAHGYGLDWWRQEGGAWVRHPIDAACGQYHDLAWADLDGDGRCELIAGRRWRAHNGFDPGDLDDPELSYFTWNGAGFTKHPIAHGPLGLGKGSGIQLALADLRGSGRLDLIAPGKDGLAVFFNDGC